MAPEINGAAKVSLHCALLPQSWQPVGTLLLGEAGVSLHEIMTDPHDFKGLGWLWNIPSQIMSCSEEKYLILSEYLAAWVAASSLSLDQVETAVGLMSWASEGIPSFAACVSPMIAMRSALKRIHAAARSSDKRKTVLRTPPLAHSAIGFARSVFVAWDRTCPIVQSFSPTASWQILGKCDASSSWGAGGILFDGRSLFGFQHEWTEDECEAAFVIERESTTVEELQAAAIWLEIFASQCLSLRVLLELDSETAVKCLQKAFSAKPDVMECLIRFRLASARAGIVLRVRHVLGKQFNRIADALSRNCWQEACRLAREEFDLDLVWVPDSTRR
jgi:hypothetical protein